MPSSEDENQKAFRELLNSLILKLPLETSRAVANKLLQSKKKYPDTSIASSIPVPEHRKLIQDLLVSRDELVPKLSAKAFAWALLSATDLSEKLGRENKVQLTWTGPEQPDSAIMRRTAQALLELINGASSILYLATFNTSGELTELKNALISAHKRGVELHLISEDGESDSSSNPFRRPDGIAKGLGEDVFKIANVYIWPDDKGREENKRRGRLHMKAAVADGNVSMISSANLSARAFHDNMELGVLIKGNDVGSQLQRHYETLIRDGILVRVEGY